jgi:hypothetical protein
MTDTTWAMQQQINALLEERQSMVEDLVYLNRMCSTLMSLLPPETTPEDVREAMKNHGGEVREDRTSGTGTDSAG